MEPKDTLVSNIIGRVSIIGSWGKTHYNCRSNEVQLYSVKNSPCVVDYGETKRIFFVKVSDIITSCVMYDDLTNEILCETQILLSINDDNFTYFSWGSDFYIVKKYGHSYHSTDKTEHEFWILKPFPQASYVMMNELSSTSSGFPSPPVIYVFEKTMYVSYSISPQSGIYSHYTSIFDKDNKLIKKLEKCTIICACNPKVVVIIRADDKPTYFYHCTTTHKMIDVADNFTGWNKSQAIENDKKGGVILKEFVRSKDLKLCALCKEKIKEDEFMEADNVKIHSICYARFQKISGKYEPEAGSDLESKSVLKIVNKLGLRRNIPKYSRGNG